MEHESYGCASIWGTVAFHPHGLSVSLPMAAAAHPSSLYESFIKCHKQRFLAAVHVARRERKHRQPHICIPGLCWVVCKKGQQRDVGRGWHCMLVALKTAALQMPFKLWGVQGRQLHSLHMGHYEMQRSPCPSSASWHCDVTSSLPLPCSFGCLSPHSLFTLQASRGGN